MNTSSEFFKRSKLVAEKFLQTAVIIDDKMFTREPYSPPRKLTKTVARKPAIEKSTPVKKNVPKKTEIIHDPHVVDPQELIHSFAKKRIVCSTYQPKRSDFSIGSEGEFRKLCNNADIVVIDWSMFQDDGQRALDLIEGIAKESLEDTPEQLRLIIAYTGESNLFDIANRIYVRLSEIPDIEPEPEKEGDLAIRFSASRIVILGKKNGRTRLEKYQNNEVKELDLADRAIEEFTRMTTGLMSNIALRSLASIRSNTRKVISSFNPSFDAAFLAHRILSLPDEKAEFHLFDLIASEILAVIEDSLASDLLTEADVAQWLEAKIEYTKISKVFGEFPKKSNPKNDFHQLCQKGAREFEKKHPFRKLSVKGKDGVNSRIKLAELLSGSKKYDGDFILAHKMAFRTFYTMGPRTLSIGTLLCKESSTAEDKEYWIIIQPRCDSVRLDEETRFPMLRCEILPQDDITSKRSYIVLDGAEPKSFLIKYNPREIRSAVFTPNATKKVVSKYDKDSGIFSFESNDGQTFRWIAELKFEHAQRVAQKLSDELSRVGLTESEWLRLFGS